MGSVTCSKADCISDEVQPGSVHRSCDCYTLQDLVKSFDRQKEEIEVLKRYVDSLKVRIFDLQEEQR